MHPFVSNKASHVAAPTFYITGRQPVRPTAVVLAVVAAVGALWCVLYGLGHAGHIRLLAKSEDGGRTVSTGAAKPADDKDDPNQVDTIVLADPADAPVPARRGDHVSPVHPFVIVHLPRFGDQVGLIPNSPAGHLLYGWLAAFNNSDETGLADALPSEGDVSAAAAQMDLREETGGFNLLSAVEVTPGVLVFRLRDQTPAHNEVLGTLQVRPNSSPATIATFSLRAVASPQQAVPAAGPAQPGQ